MSSIAVFVFVVALDFCAPTVPAADKSSDSGAYLKVREKCEKRMKPVLKLREKLKRPSGTKFSDPRLPRRLAAWEKASAEFAAKLSSGIAVKEDLQKYEKAFDHVYSLARWIRLRMGGIDRLLAVRRSPVRSGHVYEYHTPRYERGGSPGGGIYDCQVGPDGYKLRKIVDAGSGLIVRCDLSFDGREILFNWKKPGKRFQVYRINVDGSGLKQLTTGEHDNYDACWLPVGDVVFISNRDKQWALCFWSLMGVIYRMDRSGGQQRRISANYLQDFTPKVTSDGRIMFSRWDYVDRPVQPTKGIWTMDPDGSMMRGYYGNRVLSPKSFVDAQSIPGTHRVLCTMAGHLGWLNGALGTIDPTLGDNTQAALTPLTPECHTGKVDQYRPNSDFLGRYETPYPVDGKHYLFSHEGSVMLRDFAGTEEWRILGWRRGKGFYSARPLQARQRPPVRRSALAPQAANWAEVIVQDVYQGLLPHVKRGQVKQICVVQELPKAGPQNALRQKALDGHQFTVVSGHGTFAAKKVCGYADVETDGSAYFKVPADVPIYFMAIDAEGRALQRMRTWTQFRPGEKQSCIGCHESRLAAPRPGRRPAALAGGVQGLKPPEWGLDGFSYPKLIQPIWDRYCLRCHDGSKKPKSLDFRGTKTTYFSVSYDLLVPWRWARKPGEYHKKYGRKPYVNWVPTTSWSGSEKHVRNIEPNKWGSPASRLTKVILSGHPDKDGKKRLEMDAKSRRRIFAWIDLNVPYYGSYRKADIKLPRHSAVKLAPSPGPYAPGYRRMITVAEKDTWHSYREDNTTNYCCRQLAVGTRMEWETAPVRPEHKGRSVTFVFAGGLGWRSQPKTKGFTLTVGGKQALTFDLTRTRRTWKSADGKIRMVFLPLRQLPLDTVGLFYITVAADLLTPGKPLRFGVVSKGRGSRRWFGLNPYTDVLGSPKPAAGGGVSKSELSLKPADVANPKGDGPDGKGNTADDTWQFWFQLIHARGEYRRLDIATAAMPQQQRTNGIRRKVRGPIGGMMPNPKQTEGWIYHSDWDGRFEGFWGDSKAGEVLAHPYNEKTSGGAVAVTCKAPDDGTYRISGKITDVNVARIKHRALTGIKWSLDVVAVKGPNAIVRVAKALKRGGPIGDTLGPASAEFSVENVALKKGRLIRLAIDPNRAWGGDMTRIDYFKIARVK